MIATETVKLLNKEGDFFPSLDAIKRKLKGDHQYLPDFDYKGEYDRISIYSELLERDLKLEMFDPNSPECLFEECKIKYTNEIANRTHAIELTHFLVQGIEIQFTVYSSDKEIAHIYTSRGEVKTLGDLAKLLQYQPLAFKKDLVYQNQE